MNKFLAVEFLKERGLEISTSTLDRHRKEGRVAFTEVPTKTGPAKDYSEQALLAYFEAEQTKVPSVVIPSGKPSQQVVSPKPSQALATVPFQGIKGDIQTIEVVDEPFQPLAKALLEVHQVSSRNVWTIDEAVAATGVSKGAIKKAVKEEKIRGGMDGGKLKVNATDARRFADELF